MRSRFRVKRKFRALSRLEIIIVVVALFLIVGKFVVYVSDTNYVLSEIGRTSADVVVGLRVEEIDETNIELIPLEAWEKEYLQRFNMPIAIISLDYIYVSPEYLSTNQVCFSKLSVVAKGINAAPQNLVKNGEICNVSGLNFFVNHSTNSATFLYDKYNDNYIDPYFYPFDKRTIFFSFSVDARLLDKDNQELSTTVSPLVNVAIVSHKGKDVWLLENVDQLNDLKLTLRRPYMYPLLSLLILPVIFIAIFSLLFLADDVEDADEDADDAASGYWEVAVGILGIWSIKEVLLPEFIKGPTVVGDIILSLYIFLSFIILYIFGRSVLKRLGKKKQKRALKKAL